MLFRSKGDFFILRASGQSMIEAGIDDGDLVVVKKQVEDVYKRQVCRYPQFFAANKLYENIKAHLRPEGDGKGGTYFGATGCGKSCLLYTSRCV